MSKRKSDRKIPKSYTPPPEILARVHPYCLESGGVWVDPDGPTEEELNFWRNLPGADLFRRRVAELAMKRIQEEQGDNVPGD